MRTLSKKFLAVVLSLLFCCSVLPLVFSCSAIRGVPIMCSWCSYQCIRGDTGQNSAETQCRGFLVLESPCVSFSVLESRCRGFLSSEKMPWDYDVVA